MVDEPRKKKRTLLIVGGVSLLEAVLGIAVLVLLYTNNGPFISDYTCKSENNGEVTKSPDNTSTSNTTVSSTTVFITSISTTTASTNFTDIATDDTSGFLKFFKLVNKATICYSDSQLYRIWFGVYFFFLVVWILTLLGIFAATHYIPSNYKYLLPYIFVTLIMSFVDLTFSIIFVYEMIQGDYLEKLKFGNAGEFQTALTVVFIPLFSSKIGLYWIINVVFVIKVTKYYNLFKEYYKNPFGERFNSSMELKPYLQANDRSYENKSYIDDIQPSNYNANSSRKLRDENGRPDHSNMNYHRNWALEAQNSATDDLNDRMYQKATPKTKPTSQIAVQPKSEPSQNTPPPKVTGILKKKTNQVSRKPSEENGEYQIKRESKYKPSKSTKPYSGQRRATGYYPENDLYGAIVNDDDDEYEDSGSESNVPSYSYTKKLPSEPYNIPRANIRQT